MCASVACNNKRTRWPREDPRWCSMRSAAETLLQRRIAALVSDWYPGPWEARKCGRCGEPEPECRCD